MCENVVASYLALAVIILMATLWDLVWENPKREAFDRIDKRDYYTCSALALVPGLQFVILYFILSNIWSYVNGKR